jgi:hypothetical protein
MERRVPPTAVFLEWIGSSADRIDHACSYTRSYAILLQAELARRGPINETGVHMKLHLACAKLIRGALLAAAVLAPGTAPADTMVIDNVTLIDGTGQPAQAGMSVAIDGGRFVTGHANRRSPGSQRDGGSTQGALADTRADGRPHPSRRTTQPGQGA